MQRASECGRNSAKPEGGDISGNVDRIAIAGRGEIASLSRKRLGARGHSWHKDRELRKGLWMKARKASAERIGRGQLGLGASAGASAGAGGGAGGLGLAKWGLLMGTSPLILLAGCWCVLSV